MSADEKKGPSAADRANAAASGLLERKVIPVAFVRWDRSMQFPGKSAEDHCWSPGPPTSGDPVPRALPNGNFWRVDYIPALQVFRVEWNEVVKKAAPDVAYIPAARALMWRAG